MNHLATIQLDFLKEARKWKDMSYEDQKGYIGRHPNTKRKITARPEGGKKVDDESSKKQKTHESVPESKPESTPELSSFLEKLSKTPEAKTYAKNKISEMQAKIDARVEAARRKEIRAQGNLDGTAFEAAHERNEPLILMQKVFQHFIDHGTKKVPDELKLEYESVQAQKAHHAERKQERNEELEKHKDLVGKIVTWTSKKNFGQKMTGRVIKIKVSKRGTPMLSMDNGWRVPIDLIDKKSVKAPPKAEAEKTLVTAKDLINKKVSWKTKFHGGTRHFRGGWMQKQPPPGWDASTGTASGKVTGTKGSKVIVDNWRIPLSLIHEVDGKKFEKWK